MESCLVEVLQMIRDQYSVGFMLSMHTKLLARRYVIIKLSDISRKRCNIIPLKNVSIKTQLPVNLKFVFECMEESGSEGLDELLMQKLKPEGFFDSVDFVCISDNYWLGTTKPCITYGLRGISYYFLEVECAKMDLHSGVYGGTVHEGIWAYLNTCYIVINFANVCNYY